MPTTIDSTENRLDRMVTKFLEERGQGTSRRGMLAQLAKVGLGILGVSILPSLPVDRRVLSAFAQGGCSAWQLCGIYGNLCVGVGPTGTTCPSNTHQGEGYWTKCCTDTPGGGGGCEAGPGTEIWYYDCCTDNEDTATAVRGASCHCNASPQPPWCPDGYNIYGCTHIEIHGSCNNPIYNSGSC